MGVYLYWGEDDFSIAKTVKSLQEKVLDSDWLDFNYDVFYGDNSQDIIAALDRAMTPVFGMGERLIWVKNTSIFQQCPANILSELERTLPVIPKNSHLLLSSNKKPDGRLKSTKLLRKCGEIKEFSLIPYWDTKALDRQINKIASFMGLELNKSGIELIRVSVGNDTRQLWNELTKLSLYCNLKNSSGKKNIDLDTIATLVTCNAQNSLQLADAIIEGKSTKALVLLKNLLDRNEHPLKIVATLVTKFRTWTIIKLMWEEGQKDPQKIAKVADIGNPNRIKYLYKEIESVSSKQLMATLPLIMDLEYSLKTGSESQFSLQTTIIKLCYLFDKK